MDDPIRFLGIDGAGWTLTGLACAAKASGVLACAAVLALAIRRRAAATRHLVWTLGLAGALAVLPLAVALPRWGLPVLSGSQKVSTTGEGPVLKPSAIEAPATGTLASTATSQIDSAEISPIPTRAIRPPSTNAFSDWPLVLWLAGTLLVLAWGAIGWGTVWWIGRRAERITDRLWVDAASEAARRLGMRGRVTLLRGGPAAMPVTWGMFRPVILLPAEADEWPDDRRRAVLMHELAHVRRRDGLTQWLGLSACAAYWFNPLAWWAASRLRSEREQACDDLVLEAGERPSDYAAQLLNVARSLRPAPALATAAMAMARPSGLESRLLAILDPRRLRRGPARWLVIAGLAVVLGASATLAAVQLVAREAPRPILTGSIVGVDGKPAEGADVVVLRFRPSLPKSGGFPVPARLLGRSRSDAQGKYQVELEAEEPEAEDQFKIVATTRGASFAARDLANLNDPIVGPIRLTPELPMTVRIVDLEGAPIAGADVRWRGAYPSAGGDGLGFQWLTEEAFPALASRWTADAEGRFKIRGVSPGQILYFDVHAAGFGKQNLHAETKAGVNAATLAMGRAHVVEGRVTLGKGGPPAVGAKIKAVSLSSKDGFGTTLGHDDVTTDADGYYRIEAAPGGSIRLEVRSAGEGVDGYLIRGGLIVPGDSVSSRRDFVLPRGVLVKGRVTDSATGKPIAGAVVWHKAHERNNPYFIKEGASDHFNGDEQKGTTAADGTFQLGVMPGPGHLLVKGPTADYLHEEVSNLDLHGQLIWPNMRNYPDAYKKIAPKPEESPLDVAFTLRRGATVKGHLVGTDGQPVREAVLFSRLYLARRNITVNYGQDLLPLREGRFELGGCDPARSAPVFFLDSKNQRGAVVDISGQQAGQDLEVEFQPCGSASVRLVGAAGKPVRSGLRPAHLEIILTPGPSFASCGLKRDESPLISDTVHAGNLDRKRNSEVRTDPAGRMTFPTLIPGATYRISVFNQPEKTEIEFTVKPGEAKDLGDLMITKLDQAG